MERRLKERLIGASVLVMLAVILIPMVLDDSTVGDSKIEETNIPQRPEMDFSSRIVPLQSPQPEVAPGAGSGADQALPNRPAAESAGAPPQTAGLPEPTQHDPVVRQDRGPGRPVSARNQMGVTAWVVQLGSFSSEANANSLNGKLRNHGFPSFVEPLQKGSETVYRVRVGPELLRSDAQGLKQRLADKVGIEGIVLRYP